MGLFDRLRSATPAADPGNQASDQEAARLIESGHALQAQGRLDQAMLCYLDAVRIAPNPARAHLNHGNVLVLKGDLQGALDAFRTAIQYKPDYAGAYYNIGNALLGNGQLDQAVANYRRALELQPDYAEVHCSLGIALKELGQLDDAIACFQTALQINPNLAEAHSNLDVLMQDIFSMGNAANVLMASGQHDQAVASYRRLLELKPDLIEAHNNLGLALQKIGLLREAVTSFRRALDIQPDYAEAHNNLGLALRDLEQNEEALSSYTQALRLKPDFAEAHGNLGNILKDLGQLDHAVVSYQRALQLKPDSAEMHSNLGNAMKDLGQLEHAVASYRQALQIKPGFAEAHNNLGSVLAELGQLASAAASYRRALELKPDFAEAHSNLGIALQSLGQIDGAIASYRLALEIKPDFTYAFSNLLFALNYIAGQTAADYLEQARQYGRVAAAKAGTRFAAWQGDPNPKRLRVGLVSGDLRSHSVGYFVEGLLAHIDPARIELIAYPTHHEQDELTTRIRPYFSAWQPLVRLRDEAAARLIHADGVHVLIDLSGHTGQNRLPVFAWKPAPVQVSWLGLPTTTGLAEMDYVLGDPHAIPVEFEHHFTETVWRMPESYVCLTVPASLVNVVPPPALSSGYVTFGSFNNLTKMTDAVVAVWARVLKSVPRSRLLLKTVQLNDPAVCENTRRRFAACGIAPERLLLGGILDSRDEHLAAYNKVDIALDTFPYPGVTTSAEALWMGVPVLSLQGDRFLSGTAGSIARNAGLPDWIAADVDDYVAKAVAFASDLDCLASLRAGLRQQVLASPLFDAPRFARHFEDALWGMWQHHQAQQANSTEG